MHCLTENLIFTHRTVLIKTQVDLELIGDSLYGILPIYYFGDRDDYLILYFYERREQ